MIHTYLRTRIAIFGDYLTHKLQAEYHNLSLWYFVSFVSGIVAYFSLEAEPSTRYVVTVFAGSISLFIFRRKYGLTGQFITCCVLAFTVGIVLGKYRVLTQHTDKITKPVTLKVEGNICTIKPTTQGLQLVLDDLASTQPLSKIRINIAKKYLQEVFISDRIRVTAKLFPLQHAVVPNGYDFGVYAHFAGISATGYAISTITIMQHNTTKFNDLIYKARQSIYTRLLHILGDKNGNFIAAILLGETKGINAQTMQYMRLAGVSHILCVSGLHLSLVAMILFISIRFLLNISDFIAYNFNIKFIAAICALIGSYGYLQLSGMQIAATRAFIMTAIFIIATIIGRTPCTLRSVAIAASCILSLNPEYVFHPSFQLSFIAVLSLVSGYEFYLRYQSIFAVRKNVLSKIKFYVISNLYSSFLASTITAPLILNQFYIFSTYSIPVNLIAVPIMSFLLMPLSIISLLLMPFGIDWVVSAPLDWCINIISYAAQTANNMPASVLYVGYITPYSLIIFLLGFAWVCFWRTKWRIFGILVMIISFILMLNSPKPELIIDQKINAVAIKNSKGELEIYANKISEFQRKYWANWFGQKDAIVHVFDKNIVDQHIINKLNDKLDTDYTLLNKVGIIAVFCDTEKCWTKYNNNRFY